jgi:hypothetical protein
MTTRIEIAKLADDMFADIRELDTPKDAGNVVALVHAHLVISQRPKSEARLRAMLDEMTKATLDNYRALSEAMSQN